jgi:CSLREA domain-containing protein
LLYELLEQRNLLASVDVIPTWRTDSFTGQGTFSYLYSQSNPAYTDAIPAGNVQINSGTIRYTSPVAGTWNVGARVTGNGAETVIGRACSTYSAIHEGVMSGNYQDGVLKGTSSSPTSSSFPVYNSAFFVCTNPTTPTDYSPFQSSLARLITGSYDEATDKAGFNWNGPYSDGTIAITIPPSVITYGNATPTDLVVTAASKETGLAIQATVNGKHMLPTAQGRAKPVTDVKLFYTSQPNKNSILSPIALNKPLEIFWNTEQLDVTVKDLGDVPTNARYIMVQIDGADQVSENAANNEAYVPILDIEINSFEGADPASNRNANQVAITYTITSATDNPEDDKPFEISVIGGDGVQQLKDANYISSFEISPAAIKASGGTMQLLNENAQNALRNGKHTLIIDAKAFDWSSQFADPFNSKIFAVADIEDLIFEGDREPILEDNYAVFSGFLQDDANSVAVLRTASDGSDRIDLTGNGGTQLEWVGHLKTSVTTSERLVIFTSGGDDLVLTDESSGKFDIPLELYGQDGNDVLVGGAASDMLLGGKGNDVLFGMGNSDFLTGESGDEVLIGDGFSLQGLQLKNLTDAFQEYLTSSQLRFSFQLMPSDGDGDVIEAGPGSCLIFGGTGGDIITGGSETSIIFGGSLQTKSAQADFDLNQGGSSFENAIRVLSSLLDGIAVVDSGQNFITGGAGPNLIVGGPSPDVIRGGDGPIDILIGEGSSDEITGEGGFNLIIGGDESDSLYGGDGGNVIFGDDVKLSGLNFHFESLFNPTRNLLTFLAAPELDLNGNGDDHIYGGAGFDLLVGGNGKDTIRGGDGLNVAFGDRIEFQVGGLLGRAVSFAGIANKISQIATGNITAVVGVVNEVYGVFESIWSNLSGDSVELVDEYYGGNGTDFVFGGGGNDFLSGGLATDFMVGGSGSDTFQVDPGQPEQQDGWIDDFAIGGYGDDVFYGGLNDDYLASTFGNDWFEGNAGNDIIASGDGADTLIGGAGNDAFLGGAGPDLFLGGSGTNFIADATTQDQALDREQIVVNTLNDEENPNDAFLSLREAILQANASIGFDAITFAPELWRDVPPGGRNYVYLNGTALPIVTDSLLIVGPPGNRLGIYGFGVEPVVQADVGVVLVIRNLPIMGVDLGFDFGDAPLASQSGLPNDFATLIEHNGAYHNVGPGFIGTSIDAEADGQPDATATGDDFSGSDDEDGVRFLSPLVANSLVPSIASFVVHMSLPGVLQGWIDLNRDGSFDKDSESIVDPSIPGLQMEAGPNLVHFVLPAGTQPGASVLRLRWSEFGMLEPVGAGGSGEVQDAYVDILAASASITVNLPDAELGSNRFRSAVGTIDVSLATGDAWFSRSLEATSNFMLAGTSESDSLSIQSDNDHANGMIALGEGNDVLELSRLAFGTISMGGDIDRLRWTGNQATFDVSQLVGTVTELEEIEFLADVEQVLVSPAAIQSLSNGRNQLDLLIRSTNTSLRLDSEWNWTSGVIENGVYKHEFQNSGVSLRLRNGNAWQNPLFALDVDRDDRLSPLDVLVLVNTLNTEGARSLGDPAQTSVLPVSYFDVDGDSSVSPLDVLMVINAINAQQRSAEGEAMAPSDASLKSAEQEAIETFQRSLPWWSSSSPLRAPESSLGQLETHGTYGDAVEKSRVPSPMQSRSSISSHHDSRIVLDSSHRELRNYLSQADQLAENYVQTLRDLALQAKCIDEAILELDGLMESS